MKMRTLSIPIAALLVAGIAVAIFAFQRQPQPLYGYAVFGDPAASESASVDQTNDRDKPSASLDATTKAHFIVLGRDVYFDANENRIPEDTEKFTSTRKSFPLVSADGQLRYRLYGAGVGLSPDNVSENMPQHVLLQVDVHEPDQPNSVLFQQAGKITVKKEPIDCGWVHFDGPLELDFFNPSARLSATGGPSVDVKLLIGTPRIKCECGTERAFCNNETITVPGTLVPTVTVKFPTESNETITERYELDTFC